MRIKLIYVISFSALILFACSDSKIVIINDFSKPQEFEFEIAKYNGTFENVGGHVLHVKGNIEGKVRITTDGCGGTLSGKIDTTFRDDWSSPKVKLRVLPEGIVKGEVKITFNFVN